MNLKSSQIINIPTGSIKMRNEIRKIYFYLGQFPLHVNQNHIKMQGMESIVYNFFGHCRYASERIIAAFSIS